MNPNKALWEKGDFTRIAESMRESGEELVQKLGVAKGMKVLDLGCGDGTTALPEARLGADVLGVDIAANLVEAGNSRAKAEGLANCRFQEGDATDLRDLKDRSFDLVVSIFGAMFAPKPFDVAKEMTRVTRPGGRIVMGNWIPNDPTLVAQILKISADLFATSARGLREPDVLGGREQRDRAVWRRGRSEGQDLVRPGHLYLSLCLAAGAAGRRLQTILWANDERVRSGGEERPQRRAQKGARRPLQQREREFRHRRNPHPRDLPAGNSRPLKQTFEVKAPRLRIWARTGNGRGR